MNSTVVEQIMEKPTQENLEEINIQTKSPTKFRRIFIPFITLLLLGPFHMGVLLNCLGNDGPIRIFFAKSLGYVPLGETPSPDRLPGFIWSFGCAFPLGGLVGALVSSFTLNRFGRKITGYIVTLSIVVGTILKIVSFSSHISVLFLGRIFDGYGAAGGMVVFPIFMFELLPEHLHRYYKPLIQITINAGILTQAGFNYYMTISSRLGLVYLFSIGVAVLQIVVLWILPESPIFLHLNRKNSTAAQRSFVKLRGKSGYECYESMKHQFVEIRSSSVLQLLRNKKMRFALFSAIIMHLGQQLCGINMVMAFSTNYLSKAGFKNAPLGAIIINAIALFGSIVFAPIVANFRRKISLIIGHAGILASIVALIFAYYFSAPALLNVAFLGLFVFIFQIGPGPLVWFISLEIFPEEMKESAQSLCVIGNWLGCSIVYYVGGIGFYTMFGFAGINLFLVVYYVIFTAETLNRPPLEIIDEYNLRSKACRCH